MNGTGRHNRPTTEKVTAALAFTTLLAATAGILNISPDSFPSLLFWKESFANLK